MDYLDEFRSAEHAKALLGKIDEAIDPKRNYRFMEFCGGHTHTLFRYGIPDMLPKEIKMLHGPGCPVCVLPISSINKAIRLAEQDNTILCSYGDMLRVPGSQQKSLLKARAKGADIRMLYSPAESIELAQKHPDKEVIFFAVGFETTTPPTALILQQAEALELNNFSVFCNHVLTPPAVKGILEPARLAGEKILDGLIGPGHVSLITGEKIYHSLSEQYQVPITISGFEPVDLLQSILFLVESCNQNNPVVTNQYTRAVQWEGNVKAQALINRFFELKESFEWRGLGILTDSALKLKDAYSHFDAEQKFSLTEGHSSLDHSAKDNKACECPAVLCGKKKPIECKLFNIPCTPQNPLGSCMVSSEGACSAYYKYSRPQP